MPSRSFTRSSTTIAMSSAERRLSLLRVGGVSSTRTDSACAPFLPSATPNSRRLPAPARSLPSGQCRGVQEDLGAIIRGDEPESFVFVVELDLAGWHGDPLWWCRASGRGAGPILVLWQRTPGAPQSYRTRPCVRPPVVGRLFGARGRRPADWWPEAGWTPRGYLADRQGLPPLGLPLTVVLMIVLSYLISVRRGRPAERCRRLAVGPGARGPAAGARRRRTSPGWCRHAVFGARHPGLLRPGRGPARPRLGAVGLERLDRGTLALFASPAIWPHTAPRPPPNSRPPRCGCRRSQRARRGRAGGRPARRRVRTPTHPGTPSSSSWRRGRRSVCPRAELVAARPPAALEPVSESDARFVDRGAGDRAFGTLAAVTDCC